MTDEQIRKKIETVLDDTVGPCYCYEAGMCPVHCFGIIEGLIPIVKATFNAGRAAGLEALEIINQYGGIDGAHHKQWVLDQVVRKLTGNEYAKWVGEYRNGEDGPETYSWDEGIAP